VWPSHLIKFPVSNIYKKTTTGYHQKKTEKIQGIVLAKLQRKDNKRKERKTYLEEDRMV
jgi:hypothetical protein